MRTLIVLTSIILLGACATTPILKSVSGTYELKMDGDTYRMIIESGHLKGYKNGEKVKKEGKLKISKEGEIHLTDDERKMSVWRINLDGSITIIALIGKDGERQDLTKENQETWEKIK